MRSPLYLAIATLAASQGAAATGSHGGGEGIHLVPMEGLDVPIVEGDRADGRLRLKLVLRATDEIGAQHIRTVLPELRETSLAAAIEFARLYATPFAPVDAARLARDMAAALQAQDHAIDAVLLVEVSAVRA
jgi:hypothetical protein